MLRDEAYFEQDAEMLTGPQHFETQESSYVSDLILQRLGYQPHWFEKR